MTESFPRQYAATRRFSLGVPRAFNISPDGSRVAFLRSRGGADPVNCLWVLDPGNGTERLAADPLKLGSGDDDLPPQERARRERTREQAGGIVGYACDRDLRVAVFALSGRVYVADLAGEGGPRVREVPVHHPALDPRPDPDGRRVAYVSGGALRVADLPAAADAGAWAEGAAGTQDDTARTPDHIPGTPGHIPGTLDHTAGTLADSAGTLADSAGTLADSAGTLAGTAEARTAPGPDRVLAAPENSQVTYGLAEFVAAEEMGRLRGYWWAPDGSALLAARVDESPVQRWHIADPANPGRPATEVAYPAAGTANADVTLVLVGLDGRQTPVDWDQVAYQYLVTVCWDDAGEDGPLFVVQDRSQQQMRLLRADPATGRCELVHAASDDAWLDIVPGVPAWTAAGDLVWTADAGGARRLFVSPPAALASAPPATPPGLQVRWVLDVDGDTVLFAGSEEPTEIHLWTYGPAGLTRLTSEPGVYSGRRAGGTTVIAERTLGDVGTRIRIVRDRRGESGEAGPGAVAEISSLAARPNITDPRPVIISAGWREIRTAVLLPSWHQPGSAKLPVLLAPYGGPGHQEVLAARGAYLVAQWFADQGFAVVIADGRGTPGRGPQWDRAIRGDLPGPVLDDQVEALHAAAGRFGDLDLRRVGIRGWSFGGWLAALGVMHRPDVFHAAVAGAPVTDWRLYDTHYTERYLGHPDDDKEAYERCSLLPDAPRLARPLLLIHGLADDNVVVAHTLRLSSALLAAGRPHNVLPLSGVTHMAAQEEVAENLLLLQVDFLRRSLDQVAGQPSAG
jgi:dipeptidyl-peptidase 4